MNKQEYICDWLCALSPKTIDYVNLHLSCGVMSELEKEMVIVAIRVKEIEIRESQSFTNVEVEK
uniref:ORF55 n=1 Tax=Nitrosopumilaceae spindle-shaped virus TaxID=3065433 RepID=A0AAT9JAV0_9VIRU